MGRSAAGAYTLPVGNPVAPNTTILASWANSTMNDIGTEIQNSLDRNGRGGMLAQLKALDGVVGAPGQTYTNELSSGFYRVGAGQIGVSILGVQRALFTATGLSASILGSGTLPDARFPATLPAANGSALTSLNASALGSGTVPDARFPATLPAANGGNLTNLNAATLVGVPPALNGGNLTNLNASNLAGGTVPDARFPATLPAASGANLTSLNASNLTAGTLPDARFSAPTSFTPTLTFGGSSAGITYVTRTGTYQRIGNVIVFTLTIALSSKGGAGGSAVITGLPATASQSSVFAMRLNAVAAGYVGTNDNTFSPIGQLDAGASSIQINCFVFTAVLPGFTAVVDNTQFANNSVVSISGSYFI